MGFVNFQTVEHEVYVEPSSVLVEAGPTVDNLSSIYTLDKVDDKGFASFSSTVYGKNFYSFSGE